MSQEFSPIATGVAGTTGAGDASAGQVGEYISSSVSSSTNIPSLTGQYGDLTSISLTPGDWDISCVVSYQANGATVTYAGTGISPTAGNSSSGLNEYFEIPGPTAGLNNSFSIPCHRRAIATTTTFYLKTNVGFSVATPKYTCRISARRVR